VQPSRTAQNHTYNLTYCSALGSLNCASFSAGIVEAVLNATNFPAKVTAHWHKGTTLMIKFEDSVLARERSLDGR
jgi:hypothetical protein